MADINCVQQCNWMASFGPGPEEVTVLVSPTDDSLPRSAQVWGFDGSLHDEISLHDVVGDGRGIADLEWSPDGSRLAVSTFRGTWGPHCPANKGPSCEAQIWLFDEAGGEPLWLHALRAPPSAYIEESDVLNPPMLTNLAWSPDGQRLGLISTTYYDDRADPPTLVALDVETGRTETLFEFALCGHLLPRQLRVRLVPRPDAARGEQRRGHRPAARSRTEPSSSRQAAAGSPPWPGSPARPTEKPRPSARAPRAERRMT